MAVLQRRHLAQPAQVSRSLAELGSQKRLNQIPRQFRAFDPSAHTNQIQVVILDPLPRGKMILDQAGAHAFDFVGANGGPDAAAANGHATLHFSGATAWPSGMTKSG